MVPIIVSSISLHLCNLLSSFKLLINLFPHLFYLFSFHRVYINQTLWSIKIHTINPYCVLLINPNKTSFNFSSTNPSLQVTRYPIVKFRVPSLYYIQSLFTINYLIYLNKPHSFSTEFPLTPSNSSLHPLSRYTVFGVSENMVGSYVSTPSLQSTGHEVRSLGRFILDFSWVT